MNLVNLSIITPVFNGERFIESCIKSVISQNYSNLEHIIVDGGSTDETVTIIKKYEHYPHLRWISEKDNGQSDAMNKGILLAEGKIISFLNADDFYEPGVFAQVLKIFSDLSELSFVVGDCKVWAPDQKSYTINKPKRLKIEDLLLGWEINPYPVNPSQYFYHKQLHERIGLYKLDEHYQMDLDFILRVVQSAHVVYVNKIWGNFHFREGSKTFLSAQKGNIKSLQIKIMRPYLRRLSKSQQFKIHILRLLFRLFKRPFQRVTKE